MNMDRFKRRVWDKKRGRMHYGDMDNLMFGLGGMLFWQFAYGSPEPISIDEREDYIPMGCTGHKDSEGNLIYEGDVVRYSNEFRFLCRVEWNETTITGFYLLHHGGNRDSTGCVPLNLNALKEGITVLGNTYEHPSLLEAVK